MPATISSLLFLMLGCEANRPDRGFLQGKGGIEHFTEHRRGSLEQCSGALGVDFLEESTEQLRTQMDNPEPEQFIPTASAYLIDFKQDPATEKRFKTGLGSSFLSIITTAGVNGSQMSQQDTEALKTCGALDEAAFFSHGRGPKQLGLYLGHYYVWQDHAARSEARGTEWAFIFEADAMWSENVFQQLKSLQDYLTTTQLHRHVDVIYTGHCCERICPPRATHAGIDAGSGVTLWSSVNPACTHGYAVSRRGAQRLMELGLPIKDSVDMDPLLLHVRSGKLKSYSICPMIFWQDWIDPDTSCGLLSKVDTRTDLGLPTCCEPSALTQLGRFSWPLI